MRCGAVVVAAGQSLRMGFNKTMTELSGRLVVLRVIDVLGAVPEIDPIVMVTNDENLTELRSCLLSESYESHVCCCLGGAVRQESVRNGVEALPTSIDLVLIHDAARPLFDPVMVRRGLEAAHECGAAIAAIPVTDTIKRVDETGAIRATLDRSQLFAAQTPQIFRRDWLSHAYQQIDDSGDVAAFTDEAGLLEWAGYEVRVFPGSAENIKLTTPFDLTLAASILAQREEHAG